jgi:hypothetical protein
MKKAGLVAKNSFISLNSGTDEGSGVDKSSWEFKCEQLGKVVGSSEHGAFALNETAREPWLTLE